MSGASAQTSSRERIPAAHFGHSRPMAPAGHRSAQEATLLEFLAPITNRFVRRWLYVVLGLKPPLHRHSWLSFAKFQDNDFLCPILAMFLHDCPPAVEPASTPLRLLPKKNLERFSAYWYALFCCVYLVCWAAEFGSPEGTYETLRAGWMSKRCPS
jgi:hypothetical protein